MRENVTIFIILAAIFYLIACFINTTWNPSLWGVFTKLVYCICGLISFKRLIIDTY